MANPASATSNRSTLSPLSSPTYEDTCREIWRTAPGPGARYGPTIPRWCSTGHLSTTSSRRFPQPRRYALSYTAKGDTRLRFNNLPSQERDSMRNTNYPAVGPGWTSGYVLKDSLEPEEPASSHSPKRRRGEADEEDQGERPTKRIASDSKSSSELTRSTREARRRKQGPTKQPRKNKTRQDQRNISKSATTRADDDMPRQPSRTTRSKTPRRKTSEPAERSRKLRARAGEEGSIIDAAGLRRSARIAAMNSRK
ncbi:hypothetical protein VTK56DRAFT_3511 [Thermocarpiscus australiensis]